jgi:hypothetical protein
MIVGVAGSGARPDDRTRPEVQRQKPFPHLAVKIGASSTPRGSADLSKWRPSIPNQLGWDACTDMAAADLTNAMFASRGKPLPFRISQVALWSDALMIETSPTPTAAQLAAMNSGVQSVSTMIAIGHGVRAQGATGPGTNSDIVNGPFAPGLDQMTVAAFCPIVGEYRIDETSATWTEDACVALDNGIAIYIAINVGPVYQGWVPSMPPIDADEAPGTGSGHAIRCDKYETTASGERIFTCPGSWGTGYGDAGVWLFTATGLLARAFDVYPFEVSS